MAAESIEQVCATTPPPYSERLQGLINRAVNLSHWLLEHQPKEGKYTTRGKISGAYFMIALDHHSAIVLLIANGMKSAAFSLTRSVWEAYWRGLWVIHLASDDVLTRFMADRWDPKADTVVRKLIETLPPPQSNELRVLNDAKSALDAYAHGGPLQVQRWLSVEGIEPSHSEEEIVEVLQFCNLIAFRSVIQMVDSDNADFEPYVSKAEELVATNWL